MPFKIIRNDITKMNTEAIVNTANELPVVGTGCDHAIYKAAGYEELLAYRKEHIGAVEEGDVFITPGFGLPAKYIIHAVSPFYVDGRSGEEERLRSCYRKSLALAAESGIRSIAFPLISTGGFGYPKEEGMRIAVDEIHAFLLKSDMQIYLVVFGEKATRMGKNLYPELEAYIDRNYVKEKQEEEYDGSYYTAQMAGTEPDEDDVSARRIRTEQIRRMRRERPEDGAYSNRWNESGGSGVSGDPGFGDVSYTGAMPPAAPAGSQKLKNQKPKKKEKPGLFHSVFGSRKEEKEPNSSDAFYADEAPVYAPEKTISVSAPGEKTSVSATGDEASASPSGNAFSYEEDFENMQRQLAERIDHLSDSFPQYLLYLIGKKGMENAEVYKRAIVDKKVFSKIKNNPGYHPQKLTALCLCIGAKLNLDESRDLLARAGYALSPCDKTDIIFSFFIEHQIYDMIELDIQLEEHGLPCIIE